MPDKDMRNVRSIFHLNINCSDLDASVRFYELLGFRKVMDAGKFEGAADESYNALGIHGQVAHIGPVVMFLGDDPRQTRLDLMQWVHPIAPHTDALNPQSVGIPRIALWTKDLEGLYARISDKVEFLTPPVGPFEDRAIKSIACVRDPDGLLVELIEFLPSGKSLYDS